MRPPFALGSSRNASSASRRRTSAAPASTGAASPPRRCSRAARSSAACASTPKEWGVSFENLKVDFPAIIARSRGIADKLSKGIAHLFRKYEVKHEIGTGVVLAPHKVRLTTASGSSDLTAEHIIIATGARPRTLPGADFDGEKIITSREAMTLKSQPKSLAIIGAGAIGCEFADFYNAIGTEGHHRSKCSITCCPTRMTTARSSWSDPSPSAASP